LCLEKQERETQHQGSLRYNGRLVFKNF